MLSIISSIIYVGLIYVLTFPLGYMLLSFSRYNMVLELPILIKFPLYLALGLSASSLILLIIGFVIVDWHLVLMLFFIPLIITVIYHLFRKNIGEKTLNLGLASLENIIPLVLFLVTFLHFSIVAGLFGWPPPGDIFTHGKLTSLFVFNKRIQLTLVPIAPTTSLDSPVGLHALAANISLLTGLLPGEAVFVVGTAVTALVPPILYTLTYLLTRSKLLSLLTFSSSFVIHPSNNLERWFVGYFYNGPYPNLFGFLVVLLFCALEIINNRFQEGRRKNFYSKLLTLLLILSITAIYPAFTFIPIVYELVIHLKENFLIIRKNKWKFVFLIIFVFIIGFMFQDYLYVVMDIVSTKAGKVFGRSSYKVNIAFMYDSIIGLSLLVSAFISFLFLVKRVYVDISSLYLLTFLPVLMSLPNDIYPLFSFFLPRRLAIISFLLSWVMISVFIHRVFDKLEVIPTYIELKYNTTYKVNSKLLIQTTAVVLILTMFIPSLYSHFTFEQSNKWDWFSTSTYFRGDYSLLLWVHKNIRSDELILNDYSWTSRFLLSFSIKNITCPYPHYTHYIADRARDIDLFWKNPRDLGLFLYLVKKYDIRYVLYTSEGRYYDFTDYRYKDKPYSPTYYHNISSTHPWLESLFVTETAGIYRVNIPEESEIEVIADDNQTGFWDVREIGEGNVGLPILSDDPTVKMQGKDSLRITTVNGSYSSFILEHTFAEPQDWSNQGYIAFLWYGNNTGMETQFNIHGINSNNSMQYYFKDNIKGYRLVIFFFNAPYSTTGTPDISRVKYLQLIFSNAPPGETWWFDWFLIGSGGPPSLGDK